MGRLLAFLLGGLALALYAPPLFLPQEQFVKYDNWWREKLQDTKAAEQPKPSETKPSETKPAEPVAEAPKKEESSGWHDKIFRFGPGTFAGLALLLLAIRGRDGGGYSIQ